MSIVASPYAVLFYCLCSSGYRLTCARFSDRSLYEAKRVLIVNPLCTRNPPEPSGMFVANEESKNGGATVCAGAGRKERRPDFLNVFSATLSHCASWVVPVCVCVCWWWWWWRCYCCPCRYTNIAETSYSENKTKPKRKREKDKF